MNSNSYKTFSASSFFLGVDTDFAIHMYNTKINIMTKVLTYLNINMTDRS